MMASVWVRWPITVVTATSTASTVMVKATGRSEDSCSACSAFSCNSWASLASMWTSREIVMLDLKLLALPAHAFFRIFDDDALLVQLLADLVGAGKVALFPGQFAFGHQGIDGFVGKRLAGQQFGSHIGLATGLCSPLQSPSRGLGIVVFDHVKDRVEAG